MVCIPCNVNTLAAYPQRKPLPPPLFSGKAGLFVVPRLISLHGGPLSLLPSRRRRSSVHRCEYVSSATGAPANFEPQQPPPPLRSTLFPGGFRRPEIKVPTVVLSVNAAQVVQSTAAAAAIDTAVSKGIVGIVLLRGGNDDSGGLQLYDAACRLRSVIRDRAYLVIAERVDVAAAVGASGVVLSDQGLPVIVARNMLMNSKAESVLLPIVARNVRTAGSAITASASEGADFLIFCIDGNNYTKILEGPIDTQNIKVPIFLDIVDCDEEGSPSDVASNLLQSGASGMVFSLDDLNMFSYDMFSTFSAAQELDKRLQDKYLYPHNYNAADARGEPQEKSLLAGFTRLDDKEIKLIEAERSLLLEATAVIRKAAPLVIF